MRSINMFEAKSTLSKLVDAVESGAESEIIIARNGRPAARLVPIRRPAERRIGVAKDKGWVIPDDFDELNPVIAQLFGVAEPDEK